MDATTATPPWRDFGLVAEVQRGITGKRCQSQSVTLALPLGLTVHNGKRNHRPLASRPSARSPRPRQQRRLGVSSPSATGETQLLSMQGKVAIVTGAGSVGPGWGNGKATATLLARQGASVFLVDINADAVAETRAIIEGEGNTCAVHRADMMVAAEVAAMVQACIDRFKRLDILVNNVGGSAPGDPVSMTEAVWDRQIDFNLKTAFLGCKYALPIMVEQGKGAIVNIASVAGLRNDFSSGRVHVGYAASKAGVIQLSRSTAGAYARRACG